MNKQELILQLCSADPYLGDAVAQLLSQDVSDIPDGVDVQQYRHRFEGALNGILAKAHGAAALPGSEMDVEGLWEQYSSRLSKFLRQ